MASPIPVPGQRPVRTLPAPASIRAWPRLGLVICRLGLFYIRDQNCALRRLIGREAFTFLAELCDLCGNIDHALGPFPLVVAVLNLNRDLFLEALEILLGRRKLRGMLAHLRRRLPKSHNV
jgi:hypothetical protein